VGRGARQVLHLQHLLALNWPIFSGAAVILRDLWDIWPNDCLLRHRASQMANRAQTVFKVVVSDGFDWDDPPFQSDSLEIAKGHAKGKVAMLADLDAAPTNVTVRVLRGRRTVAMYSVGSWRMRMFLGLKTNAFE
jgi:hypothetical protein